MRLFEDHIENRLQFTRRRIDDAQHLGNGLLLFQALAQLGQEARILDRDHRLIGKAADKFDLLLGEWLNRRRPRVIVPTATPSRSRGTPSVVPVF